MNHLKRLLISFLIISIIVSIYLIVCSTRDVDNYTEEQHIERVKKRFLKKYVNNADSSYIIDSIEVYPIYDENEKLTMFLVECKPSGFVFVELRDHGKHIYYPFYGKDNMYLCGCFYGAQSDYCQGWNPIIINGSNDREWLYNETDEKIEYMTSPYQLNNKLDERKYIFQSSYDSSFCICAVKQDNVFINVISGKTIDIKDGKIEGEQEYIDLSFLGDPHANKYL